MEIDSEMNKYLAEQLEGGLFVYIWITSYQGHYYVSRDLYTVKDGKVYDVTQPSGELYHTKDSLFDVNKDCKRIGKYDPKKKYKRVKKSMGYSEIKKRLSL